MCVVDFALKSYKEEKTTLMIRGILIARRLYMNLRHLEKFLLSGIEFVAARCDAFCIKPRKNFIRNMKLLFHAIVKIIVGI